MRLRLSSMLAVSGLACAMLALSAVTLAAPDVGACQHDVAVSWHADKAVCQETLEAQLAEFDVRAQSVVDGTPRMDEVTAQLKSINEQRATVRKDYRDCVARATAAAVDQYRRCTPPVVAVP